MPDLQVAGQGKTALVRYVLGRVSLGEILGRARSKVDNPAQRFKVFWGALRQALGIEGKKGFDGGECDQQFEKVSVYVERGNLIPVAPFDVSEPVSLE